MLGVFGNWSALSSGTGDKLTCYALSRPRATRPANTKRGPIYLIVSDWPSRKVKAEPQIVYGYQGKEGSIGALGVGTDKFTFFIRNNGKEASAWLQQLSENARLILRCRTAYRRWPAAPTRAPAPRPSIPTACRALAMRWPRSIASARCDDKFRAPRTSLIGLDRGALKAVLLAAGVPVKSAGMRVNQLWNWIYVHGAKDFATMTNLAKDFRSLLEAISPWRAPTSSPPNFRRTAPANGC